MENVQYIHINKTMMLESLFILIKKYKEKGFFHSFLHKGLYIHLEALISKIQLTCNIFIHHSSQITGCASLCMRELY